MSSGERIYRSVNHVLTQDTNATCVQLLSILRLVRKRSPRSPSRLGESQTSRTIGAPIIFATELTTARPQSGTLCTLLLAPLNKRNVLSITLRVLAHQFLTGRCYLDCGISVGVERINS
jgi:hypothetical protein